MVRVVLGIEYKGTDYHGWQCQPGLITVQSTVEQALTKVADNAITVHCAGRTDVGVHARGQVVHFDTTAERELSAWVLGGNSNLPADISIKWASLVPTEFHARFSAIERSYRYVIYNSEIRPAIFADQVTWCRQPLDVEPMREAAQCLIGENDFSSFRGSGCQSKTAMRNVIAVTIKRKAKLVVIDIKANAFLLHMVRNIAGLLIDIGRGKQQSNWAKEVLDARDRRVAAATASAAGLYLTRVYYPDKYNLPNS